MKYETLNKSTEYRSEKRDCTVVALALLSGEEYKDAYAALELAGRKRNCGAYTYQTMEAFKILDVELTQLPSISIRQKNGSRYTPKTIGKRYQKGKFLCRSHGHMFALIDGVVEDWSRNRRLHIKQMWKVES